MGEIQYTKAMFESAVKMQSNMSDEQIKQAANKIIEIFDNADIGDGNQDGFYTGDARGFIDLVRAGSDYMTSQFGVQTQQESDTAALERMNNLTYKPEYAGQGLSYEAKYKNVAKSESGQVIQYKEKYTEKSTERGNDGSLYTTEVVRSRKDGKIMTQTLRQEDSRVIYRISSDGTPYYVDGKDYVFVKEDGTETRIDRKVYDNQLKSMTTTNTNVKEIDDAKKSKASTVVYGGITFNPNQVKSSFTQLSQAQEYLSGKGYTSKSYEVVLRDGTRLNWNSGEHAGEREQMNLENNAAVSIQNTGTVSFNGLRGVSVTDNPNKNDSYVFNDCTGHLNADGTFAKPAKDSDIIKINNKNPEDGVFVKGNAADKVYINGVKQPTSKYVF